MCTHRHRDRRYTHRHVTLTGWWLVGPSSSGAPDPPCLETWPSFSGRHCSPQRGGRWAERAGDPPAPPGHAGLSRALWVGWLSWSPRSREGWSLRDARQAPPLHRPRPRPGHWPQSLEAWLSWGWGRLRWPPARLSASLPGLRARRPGWLGCARVSAPAPAPAMGNSHHKRKAPSGPRARSFWRFGRSAKRPAGRGRGWGRGRRGGGSPCRSRRHRCCPLPGLGGCECGGPGIPRTDPTPHMRKETRVHANTHGRAHVHVHNLHSHTQHPLKCTDMQTQNHIHVYTHSVVVERTDPETGTYT